VNILIAYFFSVAMLLPVVHLGTLSSSALNMHFILNSPPKSEGLHKISQRVSFVFWGVGRIFRVKHRNRRISA
jgi:hypothetical protein